MKKITVFLKGLALTLAVSGMLAACSNGSTGDGPPPAGDGSQGPTITLGGISVSHMGGSYSGPELTFTYFKNGATSGVALLSSVGLTSSDTTIQVATGGTLTFKLDAPSGYASAAGTLAGLGLTVSDMSAKILWIEDFKTSTSEMPLLHQRNNFGSVHYLYTDKDVTITGDSFNVTLKAGWNTVLESGSGFVSGKPGPMHFWEVEANFGGG